MDNPNMFVNENRHLVEALSGDDHDQCPKKKKGSKRHTQHQIQEMEVLFKECPHPDDKQQRDLARRLALEPLQVKFWFQNKRTQMKAHHERHETILLRNENDKLRAENIWYRQAVDNAIWQQCRCYVDFGEISFVEHQLRTENVRLREEINRLSSIVAKYVGTSNLSYPNLFHGMSHSVDHNIGSFEGPLWSS